MTQAQQLRDLKPKSPCKPWYRARNVILIAVASLLIWGGVFAYRVMYAVPVISVNYGPKVEDLVRQRQGMSDGAENAWIALETIINRATAAGYKVCQGVDWGGVRPVVDVTGLYGPPPPTAGGVTPEQINALAREYLKELGQSGVLADLERLRGMPFAVRPAQPGRQIDVLLPLTGSMRAMARANAARMFIAIQAGDAEERLAAMDQSLVLGVMSAKQSTFIESLIGYAIVSLAINEMRYELHEHPPTEEQCRTLLNTLEKRLPVPSLDTAFEAERMLLLDTLQTVFSDTGGGNGRLIVTEFDKLQNGFMTLGSPTSGPSVGLSQYKVSNLAGIFIPDRQRNVAQINALFDAMLKETKLTRQERLATGLDTYAFMNKLPRSYYFLQTMVPAIEKVWQSRDQVELELAGTRLVLLIEMFRSKTGSYPDSLKSLVPSVAASVPNDPFTGVAFGYRRLSPGEDAEGRGYLLYSFGRDKKDDGGKTAKVIYDALTSPKGQGFDFIINRSRPKPEPDLDSKGK